MSCVNVNKVPLKRLPFIITAYLTLALKPEPSDATARFLDYTRSLFSPQRDFSKQNDVQVEGGRSGLVFSAAREEKKIRGPVQQCFRFVSVLRSSRLGNTGQTPFLTV